MPDDRSAKATSVCFFTVGSADGSFSTSRSSHAHTRSTASRERQVRRQAGRIGYQVFKHRDRFMFLDASRPQLPAIGKPINLTLDQAEAFLYWLAA